MSEQQPPALPPAPEQKSRLERGYAWVDRHWRGFVDTAANVAAAPSGAISGGAQRVDAFAVEIWRRLGVAFAWLKARLTDPFYLKVYGDNLLTTRADLDLLAYTVLLMFSALFEIFAWSNMWVASPPFFGHVFCKWGYVVL